LEFKAGHSPTISGAPACTDGELILDGNPIGSAEAVSLTGNGGLSGTLTMPVDPKGTPHPGLFDSYAVRATSIPYSTNAVKMVLAPGRNDYGGGLHSDGLYYLDTLNNDISMQDMRLYGTLLVDAGSKTVTVKGSCLLETFREDYPVLIVRGDLNLELEPVPLDEATLSANLNPPGAPYQGRTDGDQSDVYPSRIQGLVHATGTISIRKNGTYRGAIVSESTVVVDDDPTIVYDPNLMFDPPLGYTDDPNSLAMIVSRGQWNRAAASP
jgi:hypothetical protein